MAIDPSAIQLSEDQKYRLAILAEQTGKDYSELIDTLLSSAPQPKKNGVHESDAFTRTAFDAFSAIGAIGCVEGGPSDLSSNPKYMEGFGINANCRYDSD